MDCLKMNFYSDNRLPGLSTGLGSAIQHLHYLPFGEEQIGQRLTNFNSRYTFSAKEKDIETGYSYFGARYYTSDLSIWLSVDPMSDKYPNMTPYAYCANNPVILVDPDGMEWYENETGEVVWDKNVTIDNVPENCKYIGKTAEYCDNGNLYKGDENGLMTCYNQTVEVTPDKTSTPWMDQAKSQLGQKEIPGSKHNPSIIDYHSTTGGFKDDETPWCSSFLNWSFKKSNIEGTNSASALSWLDWGTDLSEPAYGSVGIIDYGKGKGHVGFIAGLSSQGNIVLLGGKSR
jgi:uncharacterized protein (TIGR02594 family)